MMHEHRLEGKRIGCVMTGSFCTFKRAFEAWSELRRQGAELFPIMSFNACSLDTRFYPAQEAVEIFEKITGRKIWNSIEEVEPIGPKKLLDAVVVAPCTGNTLAKIANGIVDTPAAMAVKSHLRNGKPVVIAVSTNDGLAGSAKNLGKILATRHFYFVPFRQDDWKGKPNSLVADFDFLAAATVEALEDRQIQPVLRPSLP